MNKIIPKKLIFEIFYFYFYIHTKFTFRREKNNTNERIAHIVGAELT